MGLGGRAQDSGLVKPVWPEFGSVPELPPSSGAVPDLSPQIQSSGSVPELPAQKANTANAFSLPGLALSTANLWAAVQPGGSLFGLQHSNPVDTEVAYGGNSEHYGQDNDPMCAKKIGGVNVFGGGLALYNSEGALVGAIGVSGDSSCADHNVAWRTRNSLALDHVPGGVSGDSARPDNIVFDLSDDVGGNPESSGGFGHPHSIAANADNESTIAGSLPVIPS